MATQLEKSKIKIEEFIDSFGKKIFKPRELGDLFEQIKKEIKIPSRLSLQKFIQFLYNSFDFSIAEFDFPNRRETRYIWKGASIHTILMNLNLSGYFSHFTAMSFNNLTEQLPKTIYLNIEQPLKNSFRDALKQENITRAFHNKQRASNNFTTFQNNKIYILNGKFTNNLGVIETKTETNDIIRLTNLERTLIDIIVRPVYSGGVFEVLNAYRRAKELVSINKLLSYLKQLNYIYPYHQAIGFYLTRAGYNDSQIQLVKQFEIEYDFYLDYQIKNPEYSKEWRIYYPKGL